MAEGRQGRTDALDWVFGTTLSDASEVLYVFCMRYSLFWKVREFAAPYTYRNQCRGLGLSDQLIALASRSSVWVLDLFLAGFAVAILSIYKVSIQG